MLVQGERTAKDMMNVLNRQYANSSAANKLRYLRKFLQYSETDSDNIGIYAAKMKEMRAILTIIGVDISEDIFQVTFINSLPQEYGEVMDIWETLHSSMKTTEFLLNCLQKKEEGLKERGAGEIQAMTVSKKLSVPSMYVANRKKVTHCSKCHWARGCPNDNASALLLGEADNESSEEEEEIVFEVTTDV